jgi:succinyl-CoA synthetase beta subunit
MKTTKAQFELFKSECLKWQKKLNLETWKFYFYHKRIDNNSWANVIPDYSGRCASLILSTHTGTDVADDEQIKESALHECLEVLLSPLTDLAACRTFDEQELIK